MPSNTVVKDGTGAARGPAVGIYRPQAPPAAPAAGDASGDTAVEVGGRKDGTEPTRFGDWEKQGRCIDF